jgi:hypothetical protein
MLAKIYSSEIKKGFAIVTIAEGLLEDTLFDELSVAKDHLKQRISL